MVRILSSLLRLLQFQDIPGKDVHFRLHVQLLVYQSAADLLLGGLLIPFRLVVIGHRDDIIRVGRINLIRFLIASQSLVHLPVFQMKIAQYDLVTGLHRIFSR